eukprot:TRINITY_DN461_c0_g1_i2.p1 TRINITY_DN461_c0_g1~~TRINITY_DN461_c0_g1_i2.p1  ORF type:complete len:724 (-),score=76.64 TRINITY_DN461_c0_g1_i2:115-2286(-)
MNKITALILLCIIFFIQQAVQQNTTKSTTNTTVTDIPLCFSENGVAYEKQQPLIVALVNKDVPIRGHKLGLPQYTSSGSSGAINSFFLGCIRSGAFGLIGPGLSSQALLVGMTSTTFQVPMLVYTAGTQALTNQDTYPYVFRTSPSYTVLGQVVVELIQKFGWKDIASVSTTNELGLSLTQSVSEAVRSQSEIGLRVTFFTNPELVEFELRSFRDYGYRIFILFGFPADIVSILKIAKELNMIGKPYVYITILLTQNVVYNRGTTQINKTLVELYEGIINIGRAILDIDAPAIKTVFPNISKSDVLFNVNFMINSFFVYGHAFQKLINDDNYTLEDIRNNRLLLINAIQAVKFRDRTQNKPTELRFTSQGELDDVQFTIGNYQPSGELKTVGYYNNGEFRIQEKEIVWSKGFQKGVVPDSTPVTNISYFSCNDGDFGVDTRGIIQVESPADDDPTILPRDVYCNAIIDCKNGEDEDYSCSPNLRVGYIVISVLLSLGFLYLLISLVTIFVFRRRRRVITAGLIFLLLSCLAAITGLVSVPLTFGKVRPALCMAHYWFLDISAAILVGSLMARQYRVWRVFSNRTVNPVVFTETKLFVCSILLTIPDILILLFWTILDYPTLEVDSDNNVTCSSTLDILYLVLLIGTKAIVVLVSLVLAILSRNFPSAFSDSRLIGFAVSRSSFSSFGFVAYLLWFCRLSRTHSSSGYWNHLLSRSSFYRRLGY